MTVLPFTTKIKQCVSFSPPHNCSFKLEIAFCVRGVVSPLLSNILLTPFDREMRLRGYQLTRYADDWVITCKSAAEARAAVDAARRILKHLGVELHPQKTRILHVRDGFEFLGYLIKLGKKNLSLPPSKIRSLARQGALYAYPKAKSISRLMAQVRRRTKRRTPLTTKELIEELNPSVRVGVSITNEPTSDDSSTASTAGSPVVSGRTATSIGVTPAGSGCRSGCATASPGLSPSLG